MAKAKRQYVCQNCGSATYRWQGQCADCGEAIAPARLAAQPQALRCAGCQQRFEQQREQSRGL